MISWPSPPLFYICEDTVHGMVLKSSSRPAAKLSRPRAARQADRFQLMAQPLKAVGHEPVIEVAAGEGLQAAVDDQADPHQRASR